MIEDLYNYLRGEDEKVASLGTNNMPNDIINSAELSDQFVNDPPEIAQTDVSIPLSLTTQQTTDDPNKVDYNARVPGTTRQKPKALTSIYDRNIEQLDGLYNNQIVAKGIERAVLIFSDLDGILPVVNKNGKNVPIQISEFGKLMSTDPKMYESILNQSLKYNNDPSISDKTRYRLAVNDLQSTLLSGAFIGMTDIMNKELYKAAQMNDRYAPGFKPFELMFNDKKEIVDEKTFNERFNKRLSEHVDQQIKALPKPTHEWMRTDAPSFLRKAVPNKLDVSKSGYMPADLTYANSYDDYALQRSRIISTANYYKDRFSYKENLKNIKGVYDGVFPEYIDDDDFEAKGSERGIGTLLSTQTQFMMFPSKGGVGVNPFTPPMKFNFNNLDAIVETKDENNNPITSFIDENKELLTLINMFSNNEVIYNIGKYDGMLRKPSDESVRNKLQYGFKLLMSTINKEFQSNEELLDKGSKAKLKSLLTGSIDFYPLVEGKDNYMAFHIKFDPSYFEEGSKVDKMLFGSLKQAKEEAEEPIGTIDDATEKIQVANKIPWVNWKQKILNEGITVFVPTPIATEKTIKGMFWRSSDDVGGISGLLSLGKEAKLDVPGAGTLNFREIPSKENPLINDIEISAAIYKVSADAKGMDTIPLVSDTIPKTDILNIDKTGYDYFNSYILPNLKYNSAILEQEKKLRGVTNIDELIPAPARTGTTPPQYPLIEGAGRKQQLSTRPYAVMAAEDLGL